MFPALSIDDFQFLGKNDSIIVAIKHNIVLGTLLEAFKIYLYE